MWSATEACPIGRHWHVTLIEQSVRNCQTAFCPGILSVAAIAQMEFPPSVTPIRHSAEYRFALRCNAFLQ